MGESSNQFQSKLPARITGIVFWGLVFVGLLVAVFLLKISEQKLYSDNKHNVRSLAYEIEQLLESTSGDVLDDPARMNIIFNQLRNDLGYTSLNIKTSDHAFEFGVRATDDDAYPYTLYYYNKTQASLLAVTMQVYYPNQQRQLSAIRKDTLLSIGVSVFVFGLVLKQILQRVLSGPFLNMVNTAKHFSEGKETVRFDESREDEFGYLGRFINNAVESLLKHQQELVHALARVSKSEADLSIEKERVEVTLYSITDSVITVDTDEHIDYINPAAEKLLGISLDEARGRVFSDIVNIVSENKGQSLSNPLRDCFNSAAIIKLPEQSSLINGGSSIVAIEASVAPMRNLSGDLMGAVIVIQDVSNTRKLTRQLSYQASHDMLTGLYNRRKFEEYLEEVLINVVEEDRRHTLCYLDLDQFKIVNDTCGHVAGDELLQQLPVLFNKVLRAGDIIARLGGDEFGILLENCSVKKAANIADNLRQQIKEFRFVWDEKSFEIGVSIGVVAITPDNANMASIMSCADLACYAAKDSGRNRVHIYEPSDEAVAIRYGEMHWTGRITRAMAEHRMSLYSQPIIGVSSALAGEHMEILLRMLDEHGNVIPPGAFLPAAERYNLMQGIDRWVVTEVFEKLAQVQVDAPDRTRNMLISVNLSGDSLSSDAMLEFILTEKSRTGISLANICFEITETVAIRNLGKATVFINELKNHGCRFALDDFGSGLSSFAYLKNLPVNYLKIDGSFIKDVSTDAIDRAMVQSIQQIAGVMSLQTIAERVEDDATLNVLKQIGVDMVQGYHIGRPMLLDLANVTTLHVKTS